MKMKWNKEQIIRKLRKNEYKNIKVLKKRIKRYKVEKNTKKVNLNK